MEEKAILEKLDRILEILGEGRGRSTADLRRQAEADVIRLTDLRGWRVLIWVGLEHKSTKFIASIVADFIEPVWHV